MAHTVPPPYNTLYPSMDEIATFSTATTPCLAFVHSSPGHSLLLPSAPTASPPPTPPSPEASAAAITAAAGSDTDSDASDRYDNGRGLARPQQSARRMLATDTPDGDGGDPASLAAPRPVPGYSDDLTALPWDATNQGGGEGAQGAWTPRGMMGAIARGVGTGAARVLPAPLETWSLRVARADVPQLLVWGLPRAQYGLLPRAVQREDVLAAAELWGKGPRGSIAGSAAAAAGLAQAAAMRARVAAGTITRPAAEAAVAAARTFVGRLVASGHTLRSLHALGLRWEDLVACGLTARALCAPTLGAALVDALTLHAMRVTLDVFLGELDDASAARDPTAAPTVVYAIRSRAHPDGGMGLTAGDIAQLFHVGGGGVMGSATPFKCLVYNGLTADAMVVAPYLSDEWFILLDLCADDVRRGVAMMPVHWAKLVRTRGWAVDTLRDRLELPGEVLTRLLIDYGVGEVAAGKGTEEDKKKAKLASAPAAPAAAVAATATGTGTTPHRTVYSAPTPVAFSVAGPTASVRQMTAAPIVPIAAPPSSVGSARKSTSTVLLYTGGQGVSRKTGEGLGLRTHGLL